MGIVVFNRFWKPVETTIIWQKKLLTHFNPKHSIAAAMFAHKLCRSACWLPKNLRQKLNYLSTSFLNLPLKAIARNYQKTPGQELNFLSLPLKAIARNSTPRQRLNFLSFPFLNLLPLKAIACNYQKTPRQKLSFLSTSFFNLWFEHCDELTEIKHGALTVGSSNRFLGQQLLP